MKFRPMRLAATSVEPDPQKGSSTKPYGSQNAAMRYIQEGSWIRFVGKRTVGHMN